MKEFNINPYRQKVFDKLREMQQRGTPCRAIFCPPMRLSTVRRILQQEADRRFTQGQC